MEGNALQHFPGFFTMGFITPSPQISKQHVGVSGIGETAMKSNSEIVKVQINLLGKDGPRMLQVTNEDDTLHWEGSPAEDVEKLLGERDRAYFYARVVKNKLQLGQEAPLQKW